MAAGRGRVERVAGAAAALFAREELRQRLLLGRDGHLGQAADLRGCVRKLMRCVCACDRSLCVFVTRQSSPQTKLQSARAWSKHSPCPPLTLLAPPATASSTIASPSPPLPPPAGAPPGSSASRS